MNPSKVTNQILLVGHPRCGAKYLAAVFGAYNYDIRTTMWGKDGIVSWALAVDPSDLQNLKAAYAPGGLTRPATIDRHRLVHYVRNPLHALPSIVGNDDPECYNYRKRILYTKYKVNLDDYSPLDRAAVSFMFWNKMIEEQKPGFVVRIEDSVGPVLQYTRDKLGWEYGRPQSLQQSDYNKGKKTLVDWSMLRPDLLQALDNWCFEYGYQELSKSIVEPTKVASKNDNIIQLLQPVVEATPVVPEPEVTHNIQSRRAPASMSMSKPKRSQHTSILGPRNRNFKPTTIQPNRTQPQSQPPAVEEGGVTIQPRIVHNIHVQSQGGAELTPRERQRRGGFSVRGGK